MNISQYYSDGFSRRTNEALDYWMKSGIAEFQVNGITFRIISLECVPEDEVWMFDETKRTIVKLKMTKVEP